MFNRRGFLAAGGSSLAMLGAGAAALAQRRPGAGTATRRSVRGMTGNDPDLAAYRRAVAAMKALPSSDPRNWIRFAEIHRTFCPHGNWYFLPWHRAYVVAMERVVRQLSGKADFAMPYWDWTADRQFPAAFAAGDRNSNPLNHARPGISRVAPFADDMVGPQVISRILNSPDFEAFGSTRPRGQNSAGAQWQLRLGSKTELEFNPHDGVHRALGGNMAQVELSSRDPIFYLHHANVDRLWVAWNRRGNANSPEPMWRDFAFNRNFLQPDGAPWNVSVGDLGSTPSLGYRYDDDDGPFAADVAIPRDDIVGDQLRAYRRLAADALPRATRGLQRIALPNGGSIQVASVDNEQIAANERPIGITVPLGRPLGEILGSGAMAYQPNRQGEWRDRRYAFAIMRDIEPPLDATTRVRVFCNCQGLTARTGAADPSYATSLSFFGGHHASHGGATELAGPAGTSVCIDLAPVLGRMDHPRDLRGDRLTVQILPHCASNELQATRVRPRRLEVVII